MRRHAKASVVVLIAVLALALGATLAAATAPTVTIDPPAEVEYNSAQVLGTVDPEDGAESSCRFEYTTLASFEAEGFAAAAQVGCEAEAPLIGTDPVAVKVSLTGLDDDTEYRVRLVAENEGETAESSVEGFKTLAVTPPSVTANDATDVSYTTAKASGAVEVADPDDAFEASCHFEYVTQETYEAEGNAFPAEGAPSASCEPGAVSGSEAQPVEVGADLTGLAPATTYHLRLVAANLGGSDAEEAVSTFTTLAVSAPVVTIDPIAIFDANSAEVTGSVDPGNADPAFDATYYFEYSDDGSEWDRATFSAQGSLSGAGAQAVGAELNGLEPNTSYQVRLVASNEGGATTSASESFTTVKAEPVVEMSTTIASETKATLASRIDPQNDATTYQFQFGPTTAYGSALPASPASAGSGGTWELVRQQIANLIPNTTYHYRVVATNSSGTVVGPDRTVTTGPGLPDGRAYERVSPADKNGSDILIDASRTRAADDGDAIQFASLGSFGDALGTGIASEYMSVRAPGGWTTHGITPLLKPQPQNDASFAFDPRYLGELSGDLSTGVFVSKTLLSPGGANVSSVGNLFVRRDLRDPGAGTYELVSDAASPVSAAPNYVPFYANASEDYSNVIFTSTLNLLPGLSGGAPKLYEWVEGVGVRLAGRVPSGTATSCVEPACVNPPRSSAGRQANAFTHYTPNTISRDGRRVFFTVANGNAGIDGRLYVREDGLTTTQINVSEKTGSPDTVRPAKFWDASADGSKVFFTTAQKLTDDDLNSLVDLYRWDFDAPAGQRLTLLSVRSDPSSVDAPVGSVFGASEDGEQVYFSAQTQLVAGGISADPDQLLFAWHGGTVRFVGVVATLDEIENAPLSWGTNRKHARVTPDGDLLFISRGRVGMTGADPGVCAMDGRGCRQLYVYSPDANGGAGRLVCASCPPGGETATADAEIMARTANGGAPAASHLNTAITDDGRRVFFSTREALVPEDRNGAHADVYMYDVPSGQLFLVSRGDGGDSHFVEAGADGDDVFFITRDRLVGSDLDNNTDLYDARVGGGFPDLSPVPLPCTGDSCRGPAAAAPGEPSAGSAGLLGATSQSPRRAKARKCTKGRQKVRRAGKTRCVRRDRANAERRASR